MIARAANHPSWIIAPRSSLFSAALPTGSTLSFDDCDGLHIPTIQKMVFLLPRHSVGQDAAHRNVITERNKKFYPLESNGSADSDGRRTLAGPGNIRSTSIRTAAGIVFIPEAQFRPRHALSMASRRLEYCVPSDTIETGGYIAHNCSSDFNPVAAPILYFIF
ncbi:hypothetical protein DFH09DRAFT_1096191 [Mycena vulgaris]|nr:hypothetical protein DFH09DRAFT_1096191 [Mycena vulgaris]